MNPTNQFDDILLEDFMNRFYGYGNYQGDYWLIGMEEGGGSSFDDIEKRLATWKKRGRQELEDLAEYHIEMGITSLFRKRPKIQNTWGKLIRIIFASTGQIPTTNQVRDYQRDNLGRVNGNTCLVELLPLPSPSTGHWLYGKYSQLPFLENRAKYKESLLAKRISHLQKQINQFQPKAVIFYSFTYREYWQQIAQVDFSPDSNGDFFVGNSGRQEFLIIKHPATIGLRNDYFHRAGNYIESKLG